MTQSDLVCAYDDESLFGGVVAHKLNSRLLGEAKCKFQLDTLDARGPPDDVVHRRGNVDPKGASHKWST